MKKTDPALDEILGNLRVLFAAEKEVAEETRALEARMDRSQAGQGELKAQLGRLESLLTDILAGQAELRDRLDALEAQRLDLGRLEDLVLRLVARLPLAGLDARAPDDPVN
jgi:cyanate lyase